VSESSLFSGRTLVVAFEGWNDAGESASGTARFLIDAVNAKSISAVDSQEYYDFQFARPQVYLNALGKREFRWPTTSCYRPELPDLFDIRILLGVEPSRNWVTFAKEISEIVDAEEIDSVIFLGAMLSDSPHTRPIAVSNTTTNETVASEANAEMSLYEGPVGILSILAAEFEERGIPTMSLWAAVPHYVHNGPVPKATLALINALEEYLGIQFDHGDLPNEVFKWERAVDELAEGDEDLAEYVASLEKTRDELEGATGETIAREVEKFLRDADEER
jgi:predicted ATP-grasp superfamily ATP-dependent carboligase